MSTNRKIRLSYLIFCIMIFSIGFLAFTYQQMPHYFKKDLMSYDESTNAVVTNNLYKDLFPPRLRINSLSPDYQGWKEGPDWQHIPPAFLYVPIPFYFLDGGGPTIEVRRLSYVFVAYVLGFIFIIGIALLFKEKRATFVASIVAWLWLLTPFVRTVLNANAFGYSDVVLACSVVLSFLLIIGLNKRIRSDLPVDKNLYLFILLVATMPLLIKNVLGALPLMYLWIVIFRGLKTKKLRKIDAILSVVFTLVVCFLYYGVSLWKSPEAFKAEFFISFQHFGDYEGWKKPWHYFVSNYLPQRYLSFMWWPFVAGIIASVYIWFKRESSFKKVILGFFLSYFLLNLLAVSLVTSKSANFILQGYIFILFFVLYNIVDRVIEYFNQLKFEKLIQRLYSMRESVGIVTFTVLGLLIAGNIYQMYELRTGQYQYITEHEKFFHFGELTKDVLYADTESLFVLDSDEVEYPDSLVHEDPDYWLRYYILFNAGSEARRIEELAQFAKEFDVDARIKERFKYVYLVTKPEMVLSKYPSYQKKFINYGYYKLLPINKSSMLDLLNY